LFEGSNREISNGCVRVKGDICARIARPHQRHQSGLGRLKESIALWRHRRINLDNPLPVYMLY
jgi:murein L,D-transpeptidase YcbB/YkuD